MERDIALVPHPHARPRAVRQDAAGALWGEVPLMVVRDVKVSERTDAFSLLGGPRASPAQGAPEVPDDLPGWGLEPDPLQAKTVAEFIAAMRAYRQWAGAPSYREMVHRVGTGSAAGFCEALKSDRLPKFALLNAFIVSLGGDGAVFQRWVTAWRALQSGTAR